MQFASVGCFSLPAVITTDQPTVAVIDTLEVRATLAHEHMRQWYGMESPLQLSFHPYFRLEFASFPVTLQIYTKSVLEEQFVQTVYPKVA
jgi:hypothetical protein